MAPWLIPMYHTAEFSLPLMRCFFTTTLLSSLLLAACSTPATNAPTEPLLPPSSPTVTSQASSSAVPENIDILSGKHNVILKTSLGDIRLELDADAAPKTVSNFIALAKKGYYDNQIFHRVIDNFMIQAGDPTGTGRGGESIWGKSFEDEISATRYELATRKLADITDQELPENVKDWNLQQAYEQEGYVYNDALPSLPMRHGSIAMANRGANTNGSQFFIIQADKTPWLEGRHTVFGQVVQGIEIVDRIAKVQTGMGNKPLDDVKYTVEVVD